MAISVPPQPAKSPRSEFVTAVGSVFLFLAAFATLVGVMRIVMESSMPPAIGHGPQHEAFLNSLAAPERFMILHERALAGITLAISLATLISARGLLRRRDWARRAFIAILVLYIMWFAASLVVVFSAPSSPHMLLHGSGNSEPGERVVAAVTVTISVGLVALFAWIIRRLLSPTIRAEFETH